MFCGNIFTSTDLQNHKKNHMKKSQKRFHRVNRALFLSLSNAFEEQKFMPKISPKNSLFSQNCLWGIVCTLQNFVIGMHLTILLPSLITRGYTQVYEIIFTQPPPDIDTL